MKLKIALFRDVKWPDSVFPLQQARFNKDTDMTDGSVRITQWVEVDFPDLTDATVEGFTTAFKARRLANLQKQVRELSA